MTRISPGIVVPLPHMLSFEGVHGGILAASLMRMPSEIFDKILPRVYGININPTKHVEGSQMLPMRSCSKAQ